MSTLFVLLGEHFDSNGHVKEKTLVSCIEVFYSHGRLTSPRGQISLAANERQTQTA